MITSHALPRLGMGAALLTSALLLFAQHPATSHAAGTADNVQDIDLAKMTLPLSAFGAGYASFELDPTSGFDQASDRDPREVKAYFLSYIDPTESNSFSASFAGTAAGLFSSTSDAAGFITDSIALFQSTLVDFGGTFSTFPVSGLTNAQGFVFTFPLETGSPSLQFTGVLFTLDRLVGEVVFGRLDEMNVQSAAITIATALNDRMKGVLTGTITDFPAPLPPDVNCDSAVTSVDATLILQLSAGLVSSLSCGALGDANQDGSINAIDASLILQYSAGLIDSLPV